MPVRVYKPTSPGRRQMSVSEFADVTAKRPERGLVEGLNKKSGGRNASGHVTSWHRGGGHKRLYRRIDFRRDKLAIPAKVAAIEYDPNRRVVEVHRIGQWIDHIRIGIFFLLEDRVHKTP